YRVNKACELMRNAALSLADISRSVGYEDPLLFSKTFRKLKGLPPREYRKRELIT
ncbi:MAG TPA: helix-turn-helix domain-containing protein, partial [Clostridia bacterium]|nr:helix-turn-helix domain-containing protein [Clostridia bacterium]